MITPREAIEQAILASVGAAALTRDRAEGIVADLVARGHVGAEDGRSIVTRLMARVRGDGPPAQTGLLGRLEGGAQSAFRELGLASEADIQDLRIRLAELERRLVLLEGPGPGSAPPAG